MLKRIEIFILILILSGCGAYTSIKTKIEKDEKGNETVTTSQRPGRVSESTRQYHELTLLDTGNFKPVWVGFADTTGDYKFYQSLASKALSKMTKDGLISKR